MIIAEIHIDEIPKQEFLYRGRGQLSGRAGTLGGGYLTGFFQRWEKTQVKTGRKISIAYAVNHKHIKLNNHRTSANS